MFKIQEVGKSGGTFDVKQGTSAPINISGSDIRKVGEKKGVWSKTITLAPTKNNGVRLGYYFEINVENSTFDVNKKLPVLLLQQEVEIEGFFYMQLVKINKKRDKVTGYEVVVKDDVSDFFTIINGRYLTDLDFSDNNHILTAANVISTFDNTIVDSDYKYHLTMNDNDVFDVSQFKPAIWARKYWDRIHARAGKSYEWVDMNDPDTMFDKWIVPSNVDKADSDNNAQVVATLGAWARNSTGPGVPPPILQNFIVDTEILDVVNLYNPVTGTYTSPITVNPGSSVLFNFKYSLRLRIQNPTGSTIKLNAIGATPSTAGYVQRLYLKKNGTNFTSQVVPSTGFNYPALGATIPAGGFITVFDGQVNISVSASGFNVGDLITMQQTVLANYVGKQWQDNTTSLPANVTDDILIRGVEMTILPNGGNGYGYGEVIELNKYIPAKVKQSEFIAGIMTLNNLIVDREKTTPNKIVYTKRDKYLDSGAVKDWDKGKKLDKSKEIEISFLPDLTAKKQVLTYKEDKDTANASYLENTREIYGQLEYTFKSEFAKETETTEVVFSPTPMAETVFGAVVPLYSGKTPGCNIRLLYDGGILSCGNFRVQNFPGSSVLITTGYPYVGHFDNPKQPKLDLNFGLCDYYFYSTIEAFTNRNMFNLNWRRIFNQIDNGRMLTGWFFLNEYDIKTLRLNDKIFVENEYWNINKVIDYDPNKRGLTKVELISVDDLLKIPTRTKKPGKVGTGVSIDNPIKTVVKKVNSGLNTVGGLGEVIILGKGNIVDSAVKNALIIGDNQQVEEDGVFTPMLKVTGDTPAEFCESGIKVSYVYDCGGGVFMIGNFDFDNMPTVNGVPIGGGVAWGSITGTLSAQTDLQLELNNKQPLSTILTNLAALSGVVGIVVQTSINTFTKRIIQQPAAGITVLNPDGVAGNFTLQLSNDLAAIEALASTGIAVRTAADTWVTRLLTAPAEGLTITNPGGIAGNIQFNLANDLAGLEALGGTGFACRTGTDTWFTRGVFGTVGQINITNGFGIAGNVILSLDSAIVTGAGIWQRGTTGGGAGNGAVQSGTGSDATGGAATAIGSATLASGGNSFSSGSGTIASGFASEAGGNSSSRATRTGEWTRSSEPSTFNAHYGQFSMACTTTTGTAVNMLTNGSDRFVLATGETYACDITVVVRSATGTSCMFTVKALIKNVGGAVSLVGVPTVVKSFTDAGLTTALAVTADNVNKSLNLAATGAAGQTSKWFAKVEYLKIV